MMKKTKMNWRLFWHLFALRLWIRWEFGEMRVATPWFAINLAYWGLEFDTRRQWSGARVLWGHDPGWNTPEGYRPFKHEDNSLVFWHEGITL